MVDYKSLPLQLARLSKYQAAALMWQLQCSHDAVCIINVCMSVLSMYVAQYLGDSM